MAILPFPNVQGFAQDHSSLDIKLAGVSTIGIKSLEWNDGLSPGKVYGTGAQRIAETRGQLETSGSMEIFKEYAKAFEKQLTDGAPGAPGAGLYEIFFPIDVIVVAESGSGQSEYNLRGVRITKRSFSSSSGSEPLAYKYDLSIAYVIVDGISPITGLRK